MSERIYDNLLHEAANDMRNLGRVPHITAVRLIDAVSALRAEVECLRAVEQVAREFVTWVNGGPSCPVCKSDITFTGWSGHYPHCRAVKLNATLANLSPAN